MQVVGRERRFGRVVAMAALMGMAPVLVACGGSGGSDATSISTRPTGSSTSEAEATSAPETASSLSSTTEADLPPEQTVPALEGAGEGQRSAPADGKGTALLGSVRVGAHEGYERITFEFTGSTRPAYRIQWVEGPITADGSGEPVEVAGAARLEVILQPASGFDMETGLATYTQPDRIPMGADNEVLVDLVRTGDYEAVLTWVAGARERAPFAVRTFTSPTRLVIDVASPAG